MIKKKLLIVACLTSVLCFNTQIYVQAEDENEYDYKAYAGGYGITEQIEGVGYSYEVYDASNGLPTSDSMAILGASDGYVWIGGYSGIIRYDGTTFDRVSTEDGLTSARFFFEDKKGRIWVGTNDNGVVMIDGLERTHFTYEDGLPSSSIRAFAEDNQGNVFVGTTTGLCYINKENQVVPLNDVRLDEERIMKFDSDSEGKVYGQTSSGYVFAIENCKITQLYTSTQLGLERITTLLADPVVPGNVYFGTTGSALYYGKFGYKKNLLKQINTSPIEDIHWISYDCDTVWVSSTSDVGYVNKKGGVTKLDLNLNGGVEMTTSDYQGNIWISSSTQGAIKVVTNNYIDLFKKVGMKETVANAACEYHDLLYVGTDSGLMILGRTGAITDNPLIDYLGDARIRCIKSDNQDNLWVAAYTGDLGLVCQKADGTIVNYTTENGLHDNQIRCIEIADDGCVLAGSNGGLAILKDDRVIRTIGAAEGIHNSVFLSVVELDDGTILAATDGDGIYVIKGHNTEKLGREDGLTSEVIMRLIKDDDRNVCWIITSNSIEYMKNGVIKEVSSFPYTNNYDMFFDKNGNAWIMSSYGVISVNADKMLHDEIDELRLDAMEDGLPFAVTGNPYCWQDTNGFLYIPGRKGVISVNIDSYYKENIPIKMNINGIYCGDERITPDEDGKYTIPPSKGRIRIVPSVMDYTVLNPVIRIYLEGGPDEGIITQRNKLSELEYTSLSYGDYTLHMQVLDRVSHQVLQDETFRIVKSPRLEELLIIKILVFLLIAVFAGFVVWRVMRSTVIRRQYDEISKAKDEADRANMSKSRFLANMSHEIRTPINTIMGMNEMILREDPTGVPRDYFLSMMNYSLDIRNASESLLGLINDLLDISKIESGNMHLVEQEYDVQEVLRSIVSMIRVRSIEKELTFDVVVDEIMPKRLYGDMGKIKQIVLNILTNAVKYTEKGGFILNVSMDARENDVCSLRFSVKDTGIGVKEEDLEKLFTAYERLEEERNSGIQGTGLGLDISRRFAELMGGKLWCESVYGEGSEFILTLNQKIVDATPIGIFIEHDDANAKGPYIPQFIAPDADILVVDDNPMNLSVMKGLLKATKVFVTTASSGEEAIEKIKDNHFDVVLLDHMMPGMDGIETLEEIREFAPELPVYALTANSTAGEEFYISKGFNGYLTKPVDSEVLEKTILKHLPESMVEKLARDEAEAESLTEMPENMLWIYNTEGISVDDGIKNSGGIENYIFALQLFLDTIDSNMKVLSEAFEEGNVRLYTIKIHAVKSSCRIVGAMEIAELAAQLEEAGKKNNLEFIDENADKFLAQYESFKEKLKGLKVVSTDADDNKEPIPESELQDAYAALKEVIPMMDYDAVSMIVDGLMEYKLPDEDAEKIYDLSKMLKVFDWDGMEEWLEK